MYFVDLEVNGFIPRPHAFYTRYFRNLLVVLLAVNTQSSDYWLAIHYCFWFNQVMGGGGGGGIMRCYGRVPYGYQTFSSVLVVARLDSVSSTEIPKTLTIVILLSDFIGFSLCT